MEKNERFISLFLILLARCYVLPCLDFCDNGVLRSDKAKIRQISPSLFFDVSICTFGLWPITATKVAWVSIIAGVPNRWPKSGGSRCLLKFCDDLCVYI